MIVEDEKSSSPDYIYDRAIYTEMQHSSASAKQQLSLFARNHRLMTNSSAHCALQDNRIAHLWALKGECEEDESDDSSYLMDWYLQKKNSKEKKK
jgi:hypothetical protein